MIPNSTRDTWPNNTRLTGSVLRSEAQIGQLIVAFSQNLERLIVAGGMMADPPILAIDKQLEFVGAGNIDKSNLSLETRERIHDALEYTTGYLVTIEFPKILRVIQLHIDIVLEDLEDSTSRLSTFLQTSD
jgi:hypothetical protein